MRIRLKSGNHMMPGNQKMIKAGETIQVITLDEIPKAFHDRWEVLPEPKRKAKPVKKVEEKPVEVAKKTVAEKKPTTKRTSSRRKTSRRSKKPTTKKESDQSKTSK